MPGIKDWLRKASSDLKLATKSIGDDETLDPAVYLTHQCTEKSLKTFFVFLSKKVPKTHDLNVLLDDCSKIDFTFMLLRVECKVLNPYAINARYPNDAFRINQNDLLEAISMASKVLDLVRSKVSKTP